MFTIFTDQVLTKKNVGKKNSILNMQLIHLTRIQWGSYKKIEGKITPLLNV